MAGKLTPEDIYDINKLYKELGTYSAVAKVLGRSPATIKKYIDPEWVPVEEEPEYVFDESYFTSQPFEWTKDEILANRCVLFASEVLRTEKLKETITIDF